MLTMAETPINSGYLQKFADSEDSYYLQKTAPDIEFYIESDSKEYSSLYTLKDYNGNEMPQLVKKVNGIQFKILPPSSGYEAGKQYILTLHEGASFSGSDLQDARELTFCVEKDPIEKYTYTEAVKTVKDGEISIIDDTTIAVAGVAEGDILINDKFDSAYKVIEVREDGTAKVAIPGLDEIFAELEVYGDYTWDVEDVVFNPELEVEMINNIRSSGFFKSLMTVAYASETPSKAAGIKVKCEPISKDNILKVEIEITLYPGQNGLFNMPSLKNHEVNITLNVLLDMNLYFNVDGPVWDLAFDMSSTLTSELSWTVGITLASEEFKKELNLEDVRKNKMEYTNNVKRLTEALANWSADLSGGELKLFNWTLPVPSVPGLYFNAEVKLFAKLELAAELTLGSHSKTVTTVGLYYKKEVFRPYHDVYKTKSSPTLSLSGKAKLKTGIELDISARIINEKIAYIEVDPQAGLYSDCFITLPILSPEDLDTDNFLYGYFEAGVYFSADIKAAVNLAVKQLEYSRELIELKSPLITLGTKKIARGIVPNRQSVRALNSTFTAPEILFEYYDVTSSRLDSEVIDASDLRFEVDGQELDHNGSELVLPASSASSFYATAIYWNKADRRSYSTLFKVIVSGSEIEGRVSAYTSGSDYEPIPNAAVKLYAADNLSSIILTATTDTEGKFSFNVGEGKYVLKISAAGYKELTSLQEIAKDETKFTEHILLVDDAQTGNGSAGGRITNAIDGNALEGVEIRLRNDWNNRAGEYVRDFLVRTNSDGQYSISEIPVGYYTVEATKEGFYTDYFNIIVHSTDPQYDQNFSISPILPENQIRIVLRWDEYPYDIDSHLIGNKPDGSEFNVFYSNMKYSWDGIEKANLDVDDTSSYGPETITILDTIDDGWIYAVHDYSNRSNSNSDALSYSGAYATVFAGGRQMASFHVPVGQTGTYWTVFEYVNGEIRSINTVNNTVPTP